MVADHQYRSVLLFGAPGVGKGTQGKRLGADARFVHLATGDMFRRLDRESPLGKRVAGYSSRGELVPDDVTVELWQDHVRGLVASGTYRPQEHILILDGIPRSLEQARMLEQHIEPLGILHLVARDIDEMVRRMKQRAETDGRADDADESVIRRRFEVYAAETAPVLGAYDQNLVHDVDAMGTIDEVEVRVRQVMDGIA
jgi:adenylate kinase